MEKELENLQTLYAELEQLEICPLKLPCYSLNRSDLQGEVLDCLNSFFERRLRNVALSFKYFLINSIQSKLDKDELATCFLDSGDTENSRKVFSGEAISKKLFEVLKDFMKELNTDTSRIMKFNNYDEAAAVSIYSTKNKRKKMEDRHICYQDLNNLFNMKAPGHQSFYAVCDGHGGTDAVNYTASQLLMKLVSSDSFLTDASEALKEAIIATDQCFMEKATRERLRSGTTVVSVLLQGKTLTVGWLGDSQVVLCKGGQAVQLMEPHKPENVDERERIEALGGVVVFFGGWRVNGTLTVSRAIGDFEQKPYVSGEPGIEQYEFEGDEEFLILACDGLWDVVDPYTAVTTVSEFIVENSRDGAAKCLVDKAIEEGSMDNITVMVVFLDSAKNENADAATSQNADQ